MPLSRWRSRVCSKRITAASVAAEGVFVGLGVTAAPGYEEDSPIFDGEGDKNQIKSAVAVMFSF